MGNQRFPKEKELQVDRYLKDHPEEKSVNRLKEILGVSWHIVNRRMTILESLGEIPPRKSSFGSRCKTFTSASTEEEIESRIVKWLFSRGIKAQTQKACSAGTVDIITETSVYEVKHTLTHDGLFRAIGQLLIYRQAINPKALGFIVAGGYFGKINEIAKYAQELHLEIGFWSDSNNCVVSCADLFANIEVEQMAIAINGSARQVDRRDLGR